MNLLTDPFQFIFIIIIVFGIIGFYRGWRREIISLAFVLGGILFFYLGGGKGLAQFVFVKIPVILQDLFGSVGGPRTQPPQPSSGAIILLSIVAFVAIVVIGYIVGNKAFPKPAQPVERFLGIIPGIVAGYALISYLASASPKSTFTFGVATPDQRVVGNYVLVIFLIAVAAAVAGLLASRAKKGSGGAKK
jgi:Colicin V production protein